MTDTLTTLRRLAAATAAVLEHPSYIECNRAAHAALNEARDHIKAADDVQRMMQRAECDDYHGMERSEA